LEDNILSVCRRFIEHKEDITEYYDTEIETKIYENWILQWSPNYNKNNAIEYSDLLVSVGVTLCKLMLLSYDFAIIHIRLAFYLMYKCKY